MLLLEHSLIFCLSTPLFRYLSCYLQRKLGKAEASQPGHSIVSFTSFSLRRCACASAAHSVYTYIHSIKNCLLLGSDATSLTVDHNPRISFAETSVMQRISSLFRHIRSSRRDLHSVPKFCKIRQSSPLRRVTSFESRRVTPLLRRKSRNNVFRVFDAGESGGKKRLKLRGSISH